MIPRLSAGRALGCALALALSGLPVSWAAAEETAAGDAFHQDLEPEDRSLLSRTLQESLETRVSFDALEWRNPESGRSGRIMPLRTFKLEGGIYCRDYRETLLSTESVASRRATACRRADGIWLTVAR